jgi:hypothetical protein
MKLGQPSDKYHDNRGSVLMAMHLTESPYIRFTNNPIINPLTENWTRIRDELWSYLIKKGVRTKNTWTDQTISKPNGITHRFQKPLYHGRFDGISMFIRNSLLDDNEKQSSSWKEEETLRWNPTYWTESMPFMTSYIGMVKDFIGSVTFNISHPGSILNHHWGLNHNYIRLHLCLDEANGCVFDIEGWKHQWKDGDIFGFDDANVLHGTAHVGLKPRTIMIVDVWKSAIRKYALSWPCRDHRPHSKHWPEIMERAKIVQV